MTKQALGKTEQEILLKIAREGLERSVQGQHLPDLQLETLPASLQAKGASFVTLTIDERLRGCIGALEAYQPLAEDVQEHAVAAALQDFRFRPVKPEELPKISIEVSVLTPKIPLQYQTPQDLVEKLQPGIDGVVLQDGFRKATFLPQVWEKVPQPESFLTELCRKMGAQGNLWREKPLQVFVYQVQEFHE